MRGGTQGTLSLDPGRGYIPCTPWQMKPGSLCRFLRAMRILASQIIPLCGIAPQILAVHRLQFKTAAEIIDTLMGAAEVQTTAARHTTRPQACSSLWFRSADVTHFDSGTESGDLRESKNKPIEFIGFQRTIRRPQTSVPRRRLRKEIPKGKPCFPFGPCGGSSRG